MKKAPLLSSPDRIGGAGGLEKGNKENREVPKLVEGVDGEGINSRDRKGVQFIGKGSSRLERELKRLSIK